MWIMAADPGDVTGLAYYDTASSVFTSYEKAQLDTSILKGVDYVVCESFITTGALYTPQNRATELIGWIKDQCEERGILLSMQPPAAKKFAKGKLKAMGWDNPTKDNHANDAASHLLKFCVKNGLLSVEDKKILRGILK